MSRRLAARLARLEAMVGGPDAVLTEDGVRIPVEPWALLDAWLNVMSQEPLGMEPMVRWALATARVPDHDWQLRQLRDAARAELAAEAGA